MNGLKCSLGLETERSSRSCFFGMARNIELKKLPTIGRSAAVLRNSTVSRLIPEQTFTKFHSIISVILGGSLKS